ncbi:MAG: glycosyltransferase family 2 protein [Chthoniobacterales bacterium]
MELTILIPCLNEVETLALCVNKALASLKASGVSGEVLVADNGSTDGSVALAESLGARVINVPEKGYGSALNAGIHAAKGKWIIMGDADDSYDFSKIDPFLEKLREGYDLVMGCRLPNGGGTIIPGAMPWKNRWLGNPVLSFLGRLFFHIKIHDFHCGMRGFIAESFRKINLKTTGMEFASEMVIKATLENLSITEVPVTLHKDARSRPPHLKPWRDGWRHLRFMLIYSPKWLFLVPGAVFFIIGLLGTALTVSGPFWIGGIGLDVGVLLISCMSILLGFQLVSQAFYAMVFAIGEGLLPNNPKLSGLFKVWNLERGACIGILIILAGLVPIISAVVNWRDVNFGALDYSANLRHLIPGLTLCFLGIQMIFASFHLSVLGLKTTSRTPPV